MEELKMRKRQLVSVACASCQSKHRACGSERPCYHCVRLGIECVMGEPKKKPRKKSLKPPSSYSPSPSSPSSSSPSSSSPSPSLPLSVPESPSIPPSLILVPPLSFPTTFPSFEPTDLDDSSNNISINFDTINNYNNLLSNDTLSFVEQILFSSDNNNIIDNNDIFSLPSPLSPSLSSLSIPSSPFSSFSSSPSSPSISPLTSKDDQINELQLEVIRLRKQLEKKEEPEKPLMVAVATMVFRLPDGMLIDHTSSLFVILNTTKRNFTNFDAITPAAERPQMHALRRRIVNEKMQVNKMGSKTLMCGNGTINLFMSCCYVLHYEAYSILHSTIWCAN